MSRGIVRNGNPLPAGRTYPMNWIPPANLFALDTPGLGFFFVSLARWFRFYMGLVWHPTRWIPLIAWPGPAFGRFYPIQLDI